MQNSTSPASGLSDSATDSTPPSAQGLDDVVAAHTLLSHVDGDAGQLLLCGHPVEQSAPNWTFEETVDLFFETAGTGSDERQKVAEQLQNQRALPSAALELLRRSSPEVPLDRSLRSLVATSTVDHVASTPAVEAALLIARLPTVVAALTRQRRGLTPVEPRADLDLVSNFLWMLDGRPPSAPRARALTTYLNTVVDHGLNASTFTARVIAATGAEMGAALLGALGALSGPLHGGAPGPALDLVFQIGRPERAEAVLRQRLAAGERLMGFGHRVYRVRDPRADVLDGALRRLRDDSAHLDDPASRDLVQLYDLARHVEETALALLAEHRPDRRLDTNVEFYTALLLHAVGLETHSFTATFAMGRALGWSAHVLEQKRWGRLIRPASRYVGPRFD